MDRLKEISRTGGYPWVAEEIAIIEKHADYINALLEGLRMPAKSCVFVQKNTTNGNLDASIVYVVTEANGQGELYVLTADEDIAVADLLSGEAAKLHVEIVPTDVDVTGAQDVSWTGCYTTKTAKLTDEGDDFTFYDLNDLLRPARWTDLTGNLGSVIQVVQASLETPTTVDMHLVQGYPNLFRTNGYEIEVDLKYMIGGSGTTYTFVSDCMRQVFSELVSMGIGNGVEIPLNCMYQNGSAVEQTSIYKTLQCVISNDGIYIRGLDSTITSGYVRVWGRVSLK